MTELEEQQRAEIKRLREAIDKACTDFDTVHKEICEGKRTIRDVEAIIDELDDVLFVVVGDTRYFDNDGDARIAPTEF